VSIKIGESLTIRVACVGGGPGGLFFSALLKRARPDVEVVLIERNRPTDVFGFGVVFSDRTLERIDAADPVLHDGLALFGVHWDSIGVQLKGETYTFGGNGMAAIHRRVLLRLLQESARDAGVDLRFGTRFTALEDLVDFDVVVGADGANSLIREALGAQVGTSAETAVAKFIWFGTTHLFDRLTFVHQRGPHGNFAAHAYPISDALSTFIVETDEDTWRKAGLDGFDPATPSGPSDETSRTYLRELFRDDIVGAELVGNNSRWANFRTRRTQRWHAGSTVLLGDAIHTAHFSVGSGTKMAMEDAIVLASELAHSFDDLEGAFTRYEAARQPEVANVQNAAGPSLSWWEHFGFYYEHLDPLDFAFHFFSRSIDIERVRRRDPSLAARVEEHWLTRHGAPPLDSPLTVGDVVLARRVLRVVQLDDVDVLTDGEGASLPLGDVVRVTAPEDNHDAAVLSLPPGTGPVLIEGGTAVTRALVSERARLAGGRVALIADDELSDSAAATLILSARTDAVIRQERVGADR